MSDLTKELRIQAQYQAERSAVEMFVEMHSVYANLEPELRDSADHMMSAMRANDATEDDWNASLHTLIEILLGNDSAEW